MFTSLPETNDMKTDSRLSGVLHILVHMIESGDSMTSEQLARMMQTNPVVIRRLLGGLRKRGLVSSEKGHGGGWRLVRDPDEVTLLDIYEALDSPTLFSIGNRQEHPTCTIERTVNSLMDDAIRDAESVLFARFRDVTLGELARERSTAAHNHEAPTIRA